MAIRTDEDLENVFYDLIADVMESMCERAKKLLQQHIIPQKNVFDNVFL